MAIGAGSRDRQGMVTVNFWFELASPYAYLSAMRIGEMARAARVEVAWHPFLLGPIFADRGWADSPFVLFPERGRYMWRDLEREAPRYGIPFARPSQFPLHSVLAARVALVAFAAGFGEAFVRAAYTAHFTRDANLARPEVIDSILAGVGADGPRTRERAASGQVKAALRTKVETARAAGIFGAPSFVVGDELFWGNDRLEQAIAWARA